MAVLVGGRDNVVSIPTAQSLKMLALSLIWGSWIIVRNTVARFIGPAVWTGRPGDEDDVDGTAAGGNVTGKVVSATGKGDKRLTVRGHRDRPPPCLSATVYGTHSYVKVKVNTAPYYHSYIYNVFCARLQHTILLTVCYFL